MEADWVIDLDIRKFFDSVPWDLIVKAVEANTDLPWVVLYVRRWLNAPLQLPDGTLQQRDRGTPQGSAVSPVLANLFLHYTFDTWMARKFPAIRFERYVDDAVLHCFSERQARFVLKALTEQMDEVGLALHPEKTRIVYCRDGTRRGSHEYTSFTFLGYTFRAWPSASTPGSHAFGLLLVAWDGTNLDLADSPANAEAFGRPSCKKGEAGYPQSRAVVLIMCGSRRVIDAVFGTYRSGERALAEQLLPALKAGMLLLADRGYPGYRLWCAAQATGADLLWRVAADRHLPVQRVLPDGSYLSRLTDPADSHRQANKRARCRKAGHAPPAPFAPRGPVVRVVEAVITVRTDDGTVRTGHYRLVTTLLDPMLAPAQELAATYARRWAVETGFREIKTYLRGSHRALRATDAEVARQELWAYLIVYQAIRLIICYAALRVEDLEPARISFTAARDAVRNSITTTPQDTEAHCEQLYRDLSRRLITKHVTCRTCPRMAKRPLFHFPSRQASTALTSQNVTYQLSITRPDAVDTQAPHQTEQQDPLCLTAQPRAA